MPRINANGKRQISLMNNRAATGNGGTGNSGKTGQNVKSSLSGKGSENATFDKAVKANTTKYTKPTAEQMKTVPKGTKQGNKIRAKAKAKKDKGNDFNINPFAKGSVDNWKDEIPEIADALSGAAKSVGRGAKATGGFIKDEAQQAAYLPKRQFDAMKGMITDPMVQPFHDGRIIDVNEDAIGRQFHRQMDVGRSGLAATTFTGIGGAAKGLAKKFGARQVDNIVPGMEGMIDDVAESLGGGPVFKMRRIPGDGPPVPPTPQAASVYRRPEWDEGQEYLSKEYLDHDITPTARQMPNYGGYQGPRGWNGAYQSANQYRPTPGQFGAGYGPKGPGGRSFKGQTIRPKLTQMYNDFMESEFRTPGHGFPDQS